MSSFNIIDLDDMKDKVLMIIRDALGSPNLMQMLQQCFETQMAREILEAEFFSSDDYVEANNKESARSMQESSQ